jgi:glycosyltransferase involved in cell wall biosynthesis
MFNQRKIKEVLGCCLLDKINNFINKSRNNDHFYQNINYDPKSDDQKKVLISYITDFIGKNTSELISHTNFSECLEILKTFIDWGYSIDLIHCLDNEHNSIIEKKRYDVILGFGKPFHYASVRNPDAIKIIYLTEAHPDFSLRAETERSEYFYQRHKKRTNFKRTGTYFRNQDIKIADYGILIGNSVTSRSYSFPEGKLYTLTPTGLLNKNYSFSLRDTLKTRKNYVWFGSYGAIHKGLDILIDVFNELPEYTLYICGLKPKERRLFDINKKNIHDLGFICVNTSDFIQLMNNCSYVVLPSCSEGMATSVLTCMNHGLIPIITRECGIDLQEWGTYLEDYRVDYIKKIIISYSNYDQIILERYHKEVYEYSQSKFVISRYSRDFRLILMNILSKNRGKA